jgi:hypothetical protein
VDTVTHLPEQVKRGEHQPGVSIEAQGSLLEVKRTNCPAPKGGKRGKVNPEFSKSARRRLIKRLLRLNGASCEGVLWVTLTFHEKWPSDGGKACLWRFRRSFERLMGPHGMFWRLELQERGCPHYHLLIFPQKNRDWGQTRRELYTTIRCLWGQSISEYLTDATQELLRQDCGLTHVKVLRSIKQVMRYVSKYVAKTASEGADREVRAHAGASEGRFSVLDDGAYLADSTETLGRLWGVWRPEMLPWGELFQYEDSLGPWFFKLRRSARRLFSEIRMIQGEFKVVSGFSVFTCEAAKLMLYGVSLSIEGITCS